MAKNKSRAVDTAAEKNRGGDILFIPAVGEGQGIGHLKRCAALVKKARGKAWIFLPDEHLLPDNFISFIPRKNVLHQLPALDRFKLIVTDLRQTDFSLLVKYGKQSVLLGLDEGGRARELFPFLIDTLPTVESSCKPNVELPYASYFAKRSQKKMSYPFRRVLLSFGGEDPECLTESIVDILLRFKLFKPEDISIIQGPLFKQDSWPPGVKVLKYTDGMEKLINKHDLVITHFGLTCYEALALQVPVILFNPTAYHGKLTKRAGLPTIGIKKPNVKKLIKLLKRRPLFERLLRNSFMNGIVNKQSLIDFLLGCEVNGSVSCPLCKKNMNRIIARFEEKSYFRCSHCGMIYLLSCGPKQIEYSKNYFFKDYKAQYGRTYLEDFSHIQELGRVRLTEILKIRGNKKPLRLLDIGCAYGPFLKAAFEKGLHVQGIDISAEAVRYVQNHLKIGCHIMNFEEISDKIIHENKGSYDIVSMWYVIEHMRNLHRVLGAINSLLKKGGVLAFSTPSARGISALKNFNTFLHDSPLDHFTIWQPRYLKKQLKLFGFTVKKIKSTGHHVERFLPRRGLFAWILKIFSPIILGLSKLNKLGDTFEVYAVKESEYDDAT